MYDLPKIQSNLIQNPNLIVDVLTRLDYSHIRDRGRYYQFPNKDGDNMSACSILKSTLQYQNYTRNRSGNIFTLVMEDEDCNFSEALKKISSWLGFKEEVNKHKKLPFKGFYKNILKDTSDHNLLKEYDTNLLPPKNCLSDIWVKDGASLISQEKFGVRYDLENDSVAIPIYDMYGRLVGCKNRKMNVNTPIESRFFASLPYSKTRVVYGLNVNYQDIINKKTLFIFESEKSVLQCDSFGFNYAVGISGHDISSAQADIIKSLMCDKIIVAFDEGVSEDCIVYNCKKLKTDKIITNKVGYIYDRDNIYLKHGSKNSPTDLGYKKFKELTKLCKWI